MRAAIETEVARRVCAVNSPDLIATLEHNIEAQKAALVSDDLERFYALDEQLHQTLLHAAGFPRVCAYLDSARAPPD